MTAVLLLLKDVEALGRSGDVVKVKPGYARNCLFPKGVAIIADKNTLRMQEKLQQERELKAVQDKKESEEKAKKLATIQLTQKVKVDQEGHLYGSVSVGDIVQLLREEKLLEADKRSILLKHPIKKTGAHTIELKLKEGVIASFTLNVVPEGEENQKPEEPALDDTAQL